MKKIRIRLYRILREIDIPPAAIAEEAALKNDLALDSFDLTCLLFSLETRFKIVIPDSDIPKLSSIGSTIDYIQNKLER